MSDADLVALVRLDDDEAFEELYRRHHVHVTAVVGRIVRDRARAEDVVQDAFLSALRRLRETDSKIMFRAWISEIARNAAIDQFRRAGRAAEVSMNTDQGLAPVDALRLAAAPSPEVQAIGRERFGHLRGALDELSEAHQRVIVLRELEGHSYREIGQLMDLTPSGVESTLFRARRRLEQEYQEIDSGGRCVAMEATILRLSRGDGSRRERRKLHRHARRCSTCRRHAREHGVEPMLTTGVAAKVAALLPLPAFRRTGVTDHIRGLLTAGSQQAQALAPVGGSAWDQASPAIGKTLAVIAAAALIGSSPAARDVNDQSAHSLPHPAVQAPASADLPAPPAVSSSPRSGARHGGPAGSPGPPRPPARARATPSRTAAPARSYRRQTPAIRRPVSPPAPVPAAPRTPAPTVPPVTESTTSRSTAAGVTAPTTPSAPVSGEAVSKAVKPVTTVAPGAGTATDELADGLDALSQQLVGH